MSILTGVWGKVIAIGAVVLAILVAIGRIFNAGKEAGSSRMTNDVNTATNKTRAQWDRIDSQRPDVDSALERLRKRAGS